MNSILKDLFCSFPTNRMHLSMESQILCFFFENPSNPMSPNCSNTNEQKPPGCADVEAIGPLIWCMYGMVAHDIVSSMNLWRLE